MRQSLLAALSLILPVCLAALAFAAEDPPDAKEADFFENQIRPLLVARCHECHGAEKQEGKLRLDSREAALKGGEYGPAVVPGNLEESWLLKAISYEDADLQMPPKGKLTDKEIAALTAWVKMGAPWPGADAAKRPAAAEEAFRITEKDRAFWAFQPVKQPPLPEVNDVAWSRSSIDRFVQQKLEQQNLKPVAAADKRTLLRRASFDLIGLPPTPEEVDAFVADDSPDAFERVVDRLLASPRYGERWGRHWLDVARYGEDQAHTFQARKYPDGFRYRDWVIRSFNGDKPYDRFVMEQIAGDLLDGDEKERADRLAGLGYLALGPVYYGRAVADELDDRIDTLTRGFLGLTVACARCHDHKFDPIPTADYYSLAGVFGSTQYKEYVLTPDGQIDDTATSLPNDKVKDKDKKDKNEPRKPVLHGLTEGDKPANMRVNLRGNPENLGDEVPRRFLAILAGDNASPFTQGSGRLELARAIATPENPLTARVLVNRVWAQHFGVGLVATPSNFGNLGTPPTHPELLDSLASRFMADGWSIKSLQRQIMGSATYQLSSAHHEHNQRIDSGNRLLWRMNRKRLEVEPWRDAMLAVAGNLEPTIGGPSIDLSSKDNRRRTLYAEVSRHNLDPLLRLFDYPDPNLTSDRRAVTIVPLQQLFVLNSDFLAAQANSLATRLTADAALDDTARIREGFRIVFGRLPSDRELELGTRFLAAASTTSDEQGGAGEQSATAAAWQQYAHVLLSSSEFAFID